MKLTNDQIFSLGIQGIGKLDYGKLEPSDAIHVYRFRRDVMRIVREIEQAQSDIKQDVWADKELLSKVIKYEQTHKGMTEEEYRVAIEANMPKAQEMLVAYGREERDIAVQPIAFPSWLQLLKDNPWLAGWEETLAALISDNEM